MENRNHRWFLHKVVQETPDAITIYFNTNNQPFSYQAGQFINVTADINGTSITRSYSLSSSPKEIYHSITVKRVAGGIMSNFLFNNAAAIEEWDIEEPFGNFVLSDQYKDGAEICFLAGGSGITPIYSMMKTISEQATNFHLIYSNRNESDIIFRSDVAKLVKENEATIFHALTGDFTSDAFGEDLYQGRLSKLIVKKVIKQKLKNPTTARYFICGPEKLMEVYKEAVKALGVPDEQIFSEAYSIEGENTEENNLQLTDREVLMHVAEITTLVDVKAGQTILEGALENGLDIKYSCKNGTCGSCWGTYSEGEVKMVKNFALTKEEVDNNYILLCQTYPINNNVTVHVG